MKLFNNNAKSFLWVFIFITSLIAVMCLVSCGDRNRDLRIIPLSPPHEVAWSKGDVIDLYWKYSEELDKVAEIVLTSDAFRQSVTEGSEYVYIISNNQKQYFSEEDWMKIADLFEKIRNDMIVRSWEEGEDVIIINFEPKYVVEGDITKSSGDWYITTLYYLENQEIMEKYRSALPLNDLEHIGGYWYINEKIKKG